MGIVRRFTRRTGGLRVDAYLLSTFAWNRMIRTKKTIVRFVIGLLLLVAAYPLSFGPVEAFVIYITL